jgi:hypothetical protein
MKHCENQVFGKFIEKPPFYYKHSSTSPRLKIGWKRRKNMSPIIGISCFILSIPSCRAHYLNLGINAYRGKLMGLFLGSRKYKSKFIP